MQALVVNHAFGTYRRGDRITDPTQIQAALAEHPESVVQVTVPDAPAPKPAATPTKEG